MKKDFARRCVVLGSVLSLFFQSFFPFISLFSSQAFAQESLKSTINYSTNKGSFHFEVNNKDAGGVRGLISYSLLYENEVTGQIENINGTTELSDSNFGRDIYAGTCSSGGACMRHEVSRGIIKMKVDTANWFDSQWFEIENGSLVVKQQFNSGSVIDLSSEEQSWLNIGEGVASIVVPTTEPTATATVEPTIVVPTTTLTVVPTQTLQLDDEEVRATIVKLDGSYVDPSLIPSTWTDKADYAPTEKVVVSGKNFTPNYEYTIIISSSNDPAVTHTDTFMALSDGTFTYEYQLDGNYRPNYKVEIKDGNETVATTTFLDHFLTAVFINGADITTSSRNVILNVSWITFPIFDSNPTVARYVNDLSPLNSCSDLGGGSWSAWEPITTSKNWTLADGGNGLRKVCVETAHGTVNSPTSSLTAGNVIIYADDTPPTVTPSITGTLGTNGWYTSDVTVNWIVTDESAISSTGCDPTTITSDTSGTVLTCKATSAGGATTQSVTIKKDSTAPMITYVNKTPPNSGVWNTTDVTVNWSCSDAMSSPVSSTISKTVSTEGSDLSSMGTCVDNAGNSVSDIQTSINVDKTPPPVPTLDSPSNGSSVNTSGLVMRWNSVTDLYSNPITYNYRSFWPGSGTGTLYVGTNNFINAPNTPDNTYTWQVQACDSLGLCSDWAASWTVTVDNKAPTGTVAYSTMLPTNGNVVATLSTSEPVTFTSVGGSTHTFMDNGTFVFNFHDAAGNTGSTTATVGNIDKTIPSVPTGIYYKDTDNNKNVTCGNFTNAKHLDVYWDKNTDADLDHYEYISFNADGSVGPVRTFTTNYFNASWWTIPAEGTYGAQVRAVDKVGNVSAWYGGIQGVGNSCKYTVDWTAPNTPTLASPADGYKTKGIAFDQKWDSVSGANLYEYQSCNVDPGDSNEQCSNVKYSITQTGTTKSVTVGQPDSHFWWRVRARDAAGNWSFWSESRELYIDNTAPVISGIADINVNTDLHSNHAVVSYTPTATDGVDGPVTVGCSPISDTSFALGSTTVTCNATDFVGNTTTKTFKVTVSDGEAPTVVGTPSTDTPTNNNKPIWTWGGATDNVGVDHYVFYWDTVAGGETNYSGNLTSLSFAHTDALADGMWYGKVKAFDGAGNVLVSDNGSVLIDTVLPTSKITSPLNTTSGSRVFLNDWNGSILGTATDNSGGSGLNRVVFSIKRISDGKYYTETDGWIDGTEAMRITATGTVTWNFALPSPVEDEYTITSHAVDNAGNVENSYTIMVVLDKTIPEVAISLNPSVTDAANGWYKTQPEVTLTATDAYLDGVQYQWDSQTGTWTDYSSPFKPGTEGAHVLYYRAHDKANNYSEVGVKNIKWNKTSLKNGPLNVNVSPNPTSESTSKVKWDAAVSDTIGIDRYEVQWKMKNGSGSTYMKSVGNDIREYTINNLTEGVWEVKVTAFDASGNSTSASADLTVDRTGPAVPTLSIFGTSAGSVSLSWSKIEEANNYIIWYGTIPGLYQYGAKVGDTQSYTVQGLGAGSYYFIVKAVDPSGNQSGNSNEVSTGSIAGAPGAAANTPAQGFSQNVLGANTITPTLTPKGSVLGTAAKSGKKTPWWWPWILLLLLPPGGWIVYKKWKKKNLKTHHLPS